MIKKERCTPYFYLIIFFCSVLTSSTVMGADMLEFVFYQPNASFKDNMEAVTAIRSLDKFLSKELNTTVKGNFFQKETDMRNFIKNHKAAFVFLDIRYFIKNYKKERIRPILVPTRNGRQYTRAVVLVRKDAGVKTIFDLEGKTLATTGQGSINNNYLSNVVFEKMIDVQKYFSMKMVDTSNSAIMAVSYKEADVAIVDKVIFDSNFPQKGDFDILFTSNYILLPPLCIYEDNLKPEYIELLKQAFKKIAKSPVANDFHKPLVIDGWIDVNLDVYREVEKLLTTAPDSFRKNSFLTETEGMQQKMEPIAPEFEPEKLQVFAHS